MSNRPGAGPLLREWRARRRLSQLELSSRSGVSTRHLSCVETGRATPSRELLLHLAAEMHLPNRDANELLLAAGYAPVFTQHPLDSGEMAPVAATLRVILDRSDPNPTTVIDTRWDLVDANQAAMWLCQDVADHLLTPPVNIARLTLHPDGLAPHIVNFEEYSAHLLHQMRRTLAVTHDAQLADLVEELAPLAAAEERAGLPEPTVVLPLRAVVGGTELSFMSTITTFGAARDVTLSELSIETLYPTDDATAAVLAARPWLGVKGAQLDRSA